MEGKGAISRGVKAVAAYEKWILSAISDAINDGEKIDEEIIQLSIPPTLKATAYRSMFAYGNHIRVKSAETQSGYNGFWSCSCIWNNVSLKCQ